MSIKNQLDTSTFSVLLVRMGIGSIWCLRLDRTELRGRCGILKTHRIQQVVGYIQGRSKSVGFHSASG